MTVHIQDIPRARVLSNPRPQPRSRAAAADAPEGLGLSKALFSDPWSSRRSLPEPSEPSGSFSGPSNNDEGASLPRDAMQTLLDQILDPETARIHPTWFLPEEPEHLPESLLDFLPRDIADRVRLLVGPTLVRGDHMNPELALEAARALWGHLSPAEPVSPLGKQLWALPEDGLERVLETAGIELAGSLLALVPERGAAALCATLPPIQARSLWLARKSPVFPTSASWVRAMVPALGKGASLALIRQFAMVVLTSALSDHPGDAHRVARRLYRTWFPLQQRDDGKANADARFVHRDMAAARLEELARNQTASQPGDDSPREDDPRPQSGNYPSQHES